MLNKTIYVGSDHRGFELKKTVIGFLSEEGYKVEDIGPLSYDSDDDYPDYALKVCKKVLKDGGKGILICGSGMGMDRAANKINGIYASACWNEKSAEMAKRHGDINVLCLGSDFVKPKMAESIIKIWLEEPFEGGRHERRIRKIKKIEKELR